MATLTQITQSPPIDVYTHILGFNVKDDTIVTIFITLFVFLAGLLATIYNERRKENKRLKELEQFFYTIAEMIEGPIEALISELSSISEKLKENNTDNLLLKCFSAFDIFNNQLNINPFDSYKIFISKKKGDIKIRSKNYYELFQGLYSIKAINDSYKSDFVSLMQKEVHWQKIWNDNLQEIVNYFVMMLERNNYKLDDSLLRDYNDIVKEWHGISNYTDMFIAYENYLLRIKNLHLKYHASHQLSNLLVLLHKCQYAYHELVNIRLFSASVFMQHAEDLKGHRNLIKSAIAAIK
jgi:hypothetical protein